ncbi:DEAD/DEAH box helicase [Streptococcus sanguinis]|uniref:DEAD/DEAH box helicase n=1 Tax=Streptococcus sanguinis TaxID=1305 RepID=UPI000779A0E2|nr:AAA domain-containing protein [Streptococcus sanguinis]
MKSSQNRILDAWIAVEQLSEGNIEKSNSKFNIFQGNDYHLILKEFLNRQKLKSSSGIAIYCGIFPFQKIIKELRGKYNLKATDEELGKSSYKFTFALYFDKDLNFLANKLFFTMSGQICKNGELPKDFLMAENELREQLGQAFLDGEFNEVLSELLNKYEISPSDCRYYFVKNFDDEINLHSFFIKDLKYAKSINNENLNRYLSGFDSVRVNLDSNKESSHFNPNNLETILEPKNYPLGRFPSNPEYALSMMQQVAVNLASNEDEDIRSVNGPPGTGKTTLLKDVFADLVTEQARIISELSTPKLKGNLVYHDNPYLIAKLPKEIADKGIVVASSNNGAVKNIVNELPQRKEIYQKSNWLDELEKIDYFAEISNNLLLEDEDVSNDKKYWGLFSIEGGKKQNRDRLQNVLKAIQQELNSDKFQSNPSVYEEFKIQYQRLLDKREKMQEIAAKIRLHVKLKNAYQRFELEFQQEDAQRCSELSKIREKHTQLENSKKEIESELFEHERLISMLYVNKQIAAQDVELIKLQAPRFLWLKRLFTPSKLDTYFMRLNQANETLKAELKKVRDESQYCHGLQKEIKKYELELNQLSQRQQKYNEWKSKEEDKLIRHRDKLLKIQSELATCSVKKLNFSVRYEELQVSNFWFDDDYREEQSRLFIKALAVRKQFIYDNKKHFEKALWIWEKPQSYSMRDNASDLYKAAWDWVNFSVPVISTTFASFNSMFWCLPENSIGNVFIDEAGQALPQASVGAIFRSKRIMAVGDPSQIQPVQTIDKNILGFLAQHHKIDSKYLVSSTQELMDSASRYGFKKQDGTWIGLPLWVHRRSSDPMFSISNKISYDNLMVQGKEKALGLGKWFDVSGGAKDKFVPEQADYLKEELQKRHEEFDDIYVITPFKNVSVQLAKELDEIGFTRRENGKPVNVGTVHTFQGKENKIVYFVLGADNMSEGAARWAVSEPNILNVAATRAKEEFYIIGNKSLYRAIQSPIIRDTINILDAYQSS